MFRGDKSQVERVRAFANLHPTDPIAQRAAASATNTRMFPPSDSVHIRTLSDAESFVGLSETIIRDWWARYTANNNHYHLLNRNCSTITAGALLAGGGAHYASTPVGSGAFWTPEKAFTFGKDIKKAIDEAQEKCVIGATRAAAIEGIPRGAGVGDVWTKEQWYEASKLGVFSRRYKLLEEIDNLLLFYHGTLLPKTLPANFKSELIIECLSRIQAKLYQILAEREGSQRKAAIGRLAAQCSRKKRSESRDLEVRLAEAARAAERAAEQADLVRQRDDLQRQLDALGADARNSIEPRVRRRAIRIQQDLDIIRLQIAMV